MGQKEYNIQKNLVGILFEEENLFLHADGSVDEMRVLEKLKQSGLLKLFYEEPQELSLSFVTKENPLIFMRVINEALFSMGYNYFLTERAVKSLDSFVWDIIISTENIVDPLILSKELEARGSFIESVERRGESEWRYVINTDNIRVKAQKIEAGMKTDLRKPIKPYWILVEEIKTISFSSKIADRWHPSIIFYSDKLHIISDYRKDSPTNRLKLPVPIDAKYIKVSDLHTLDNIKRGISVYLTSRD